MSIDAASARVRVGPLEDDEASPFMAWAGVIPTCHELAPRVPDPRNLPEVENAGLRIV
jgi:hypothetical protein